MLAIIYSIDLKFPKCVIFLSQNRDEFFLFLYFCFFLSPPPSVFSRNYVNLKNVYKKLYGIYNLLMKNHKVNLDKLNLERLL